MSDQEYANYRYTGLEDLYNKQVVIQSPLGSLHIKLKYSNIINRSWVDAAILKFNNG